MTTTHLNSHPLAIVVFDIDGVIREVTGSHFRAVSDTVRHFTKGAWHPNQQEIDQLLFEGIWNNDYEVSRELIYRYYESQGQSRSEITIDFPSLVNFFEDAYWGDESTNRLGYIHQEELLVNIDYFENLTQAKILWGFFTGATRPSAEYVLEKRLGLKSPLIFAVEDGPNKPHPEGLFSIIQELELLNQVETLLPVIFAGDTVTDQETINSAEQLQPQRHWMGIGILPPHVQQSSEQTQVYKNYLSQAGAKAIFSSIEDLTPEKIADLIKN
jgi:HAD superfamily phosphatase